MAAVPLYARDGSVRAQALIDDADLHLFDEHRWCFSTTKGWVQRTAREGGTQRTVTLHRELLGLAPGDGLQVDHINGDRLDNRRCNLRVVTNAQNAQNRPSYQGASSRFRGVGWDKRSRRWIARVVTGGTFHALGSFESELEAAEAARQGRERLLPFAVS